MYANKQGARVRCNTNWKAWETQQTNACTRSRSRHICLVSATRRKETPSWQKCAQLQSETSEFRGRKSNTSARCVSLRTEFYLHVSKECQVWTTETADNHHASYASSFPVGAFTPLSKRCRCDVNGSQWSQWNAKLSNIVNNGVIPFLFQNVTRILLVTRAMATAISNARTDLYERPVIYKQRGFRYCARCFLRVKTTLLPRSAIRLLQHKVISRFTALPFTTGATCPFLQVPLHQFNPHKLSPSMSATHTQENYVNFGRPGFKLIWMDRNDKKERAENSLKCHLFSLEITTTLGASSISCCQHQKWRSLHQYNLHCELLSILSGNAGELFDSREFI